MSKKVQCNRESNAAVMLCIVVQRLFLKMQRLHYYIKVLDT